MPMSSYTPQGTLSVIRGHITFPDMPDLDTTMAYMMPDGMTWIPQNAVSTQIPTATGIVTSQGAKLQVQVQIPLIRSQAHCQTWYNQMLTNTYLGTATITPDTTTQATRTLREVSLLSVGQEGMGGMSAGWVVTIGGYMIVNADLWNGV